jgi:hypothetical protein
MQETPELRLLSQIKAEFPTDKSCLDDLYLRKYKHKKATCWNCGSTDVKRKGDRKIYCRNCKKSHSFTADTIFGRTKKV